MYQKRIDEIISGMLYFLCIAYDILFGGFDEQGKDHNKSLDKVLADRQTWSLTKISVFFSNVPSFLSFVK